MRNDSSAFIAVVGWILLIVGMIATLVCSSARAEDASTCRKDFKTGDENYGKGRFEDALRYFRLSYEAKQSPRTLYYIGLCQMHLHRYIESIDTLKQFLNHPEAKPRFVRYAKKEIKKMEAQIGEFAIEVEPDGAEVQLYFPQMGDAFLPRKWLGKTPLSEPLRLIKDVKPYEIEVSKEGYVPSGQKITVDGGEKKTIKVVLVLTPTRLSATCRPEKGVILTIDDSLEKVGCPHTWDVTPGHHFVRGTANGRAVFDQIDVELGETVPVELDLLPPSSASAGPPVPKNVPILERVYSKSAGLHFLKHEVTVLQYRACVDAGVCSEPKDYKKREYCNWGYSDERRANHPINCVTVDQAEKFCDWIDGRLPEKKEWVADASNEGGQDWPRDWPWGDTPEVSCDSAVWGVSGKNDGCGRDGTWPVCSKKKGNSVSGLCDMSGNVMELTTEHKSVLVSSSHVTNDQIINAAMSGAHAEAARLAEERKNFQPYVQSWTVYHFCGGGWHSDMRRSLKTHCERKGRVTHSLKFGFRCVWQSFSGQPE